MDYVLVAVWVMLAGIVVMSVVSRRAQRRIIRGLPQPVQPPVNLDELRQNAEAAGAMYRQQLAAAANQQAAYNQGLHGGVGGVGMPIGVNVMAYGGGMYFRGAGGAGAHVVGAGDGPAYMPYGAGHFAGVFQKNIETVNAHPEQKQLSETHKLTHVDDTGRLFHVFVPTKQEPWRAYVDVVNPTPHTDGSLEQHYLSVPPTIKTAKEAVAWTFGLTPEEYLPLKET